MAGRPLVALGVGLAAAVLAAAALVPTRAWGAAIVPVLATVLVGGIAMGLVARRRPPEGEAPDHDPFGLIGDRLDRFAAQDDDGDDA